MRKWLVAFVFAALVLWGGTQSIAGCVGPKCNVDENQGFAPPPLVPPAKVYVDQPKPVRGDDSCSFAFNEVCDEPSKCKVGTDSHDCGPRAKP
jgi:hypothetical protein